MKSKKRIKNKEIIQAQKGTRFLYFSAVFMRLKIYIEKFQTNDILISS